MLQVTIVLDAQPAFRLTEEVRARVEDPSPWAREVPGIILRGPGSFGEQIDRRTHLDLEGGATAWRDAPYAQGREGAHDHLLFDALRGRSPASISTVTKYGAVVGVRDLILRQLYAAAGNRLVSPAPYAGPLTGYLGERPGPFLAKPAKPVNPANRHRNAYGRSRSRPKPRNVTAWSIQKAMFWALGYGYDYWPTEAELRTGILSYPRAVGRNPVMLGRLRQRLLEHVVGKARLARGAALDPRRAA